MGKGAGARALIPRPRPPEPSAQTRTQCGLRYGNMRPAGIRVVHRDARAACIALNWGHGGSSEGDPL